MRFDLDLIVSPSLNYAGLSYGNWVEIWWNWLFSNQEQTGTMYFLRGNVDLEDGIVKTRKEEIYIF